METHSHDPHHHSHDLLGDDSEVLQNRNSEFLGISEDKAFFIYLSSGQDDDWKLYYGDNAARKITEHDVESVESEMDRQLTVRTNDSVLVVIAESASWNDLPLQARNTDDYTIVEKSSGQLIFQSSKH